MTQNVYDNSEFFGEYSRLCRSVEGLVGAMEWPALRPLVPDLRGLKVVAPRHPEWVVGADGRKTWPVDSYGAEGPRTTDWLAEGVIKQHRTMGTTLNTLIRCGFAIFHVEEWGPTDHQIRTIRD